jgi:protein subunit release factor A
VLRQRVREASQAERHQETNQDHRGQIGCGARGDKIRTVQMHNGIVTNHETGKKISVDRYLKGYVEDIQ